MKKFIKIGMAGAVCALLYVPTVNAKVVNNTSTPVKQVKSTHLRTFKNTIAFLEKKLVAARPEQEQPIETTPRVAEITDFFPKDTPLLVSFNTSSETWGSLNRFHLFHMVQQGISQLIPKDANINFDYVRDVQSWLGEEVGVGFLPKVTNQTATIESSLVVVAPIRDMRRLQSLIDIIEQDKSKVKVKKYKDATIYEIDISPAKTEPVTAFKTKSIPTKLPSPEISEPNTLVIASLNGYVALSFSAKPIERLVDTKSANVGIIGQKPEFKDFTRRQGTQALYSMYQNPYEYMVLFNDLIKDVFKSDEFKDFKGILDSKAFKPEQYKQYKSIYSSLAPQPEGLRFQVQTFLNPNKSKSAKIEDKITSRMPGATYSALTGSNISLQWQTLATILSASIPEFNNGLKGFRELVKLATGLDFDKEIIGWMDGEYGFFMYPTKGGFFNTISPNFNLGIGLVVKTTNRNLAEKTLTKLGDLIKTSTNGEVVAKNIDIKGQAVTTWTPGKDSSKSLFALSWVDKDTLIVTSGSGAMADLVPRPKAPLASTYNFSNATSSLPYPNQGYFYVNTGSFLSWIYGFVPQEYQSNEYFKVFKQAAGSVRSLSATTSKINQPEQLGEQFDFLVTLAPTLKQTSSSITSH
ncbi:hypothetical protein NIES4071_56300 [Calothrix sp. NIES-4071]|nr:hypothetical protein NIES4071_56300 [Calothrix sp. NIES-4071]BAZ59937.1 hypothetical protein NIES4105_56250 [Calothrix sp. NIES-4105]